MRSLSERGKDPASVEVHVIQMATRTLLLIVTSTWLASLGLVPILASRPESPRLPQEQSAEPPQVEEVAEVTNADCLLCHSETVDEAKFAASVHGAMEFSCTTCHSDLDGAELPHATPLAKVDCSMCHDEAVQAYAESVHAVARQADANSPAATCVDCHSAHETQSTAAGAWRLDLVSECGTCHIDKIRTYRDTFHGQVTSLGFERVAKCSDCHGAHNIHSGSDPRSMVSDAQVLTTCQTCHAEAGPGFAEYDPHADKNDVERNPEMYYTATFMHWLLLGVFSVFGVHALLWFPRSAIERRRRREEGSE